MSNHEHCRSTNPRPLVPRCPQKTLSERSVRLTAAPHVAVCSPAGSASALRLHPARCEVVLQHTLQQLAPRINYKKRTAQTKGDGDRLTGLQGARWQRPMGHRINHTEDCHNYQLFL